MGKHNWMSRLKFGRRRFPPKKLLLLRSRPESVGSSPSSPSQERSTHPYTFANDAIRDDWEPYRSQRNVAADTRRI